MARVPKRKREDLSDTTTHPSDASPLASDTTPLTSDANSDQASPSTPRRSKRLQSRTLPRAISVTSIAPSIASVEIASQSTWQDTLARAQTRIQEYNNGGRKHEESLPAMLNAALLWLPEGGRDAMAQGIIRESDDSGLWEVFDNFRGGVLNASRLVPPSLS